MPVSSEKPLKMVGENAQGVSGIDLMQYGSRLRAREILIPALFVIDFGPALV
jgi:hypothetical protein